MFLLNEILVFGHGRRQEALDRLAWIHGLMAKQPSFRRAIVAKYLGHGLRHTVLRIWDSADAYQEFRSGPNGNYGSSRPAGLYTNETVIPQWESIVDTPGTEAAAKHLVKVQQEVPEGAWDEFAKHRQALQQIMASGDGFIRGVTYRAKDRSESLFVGLYGAREHHERVLDHPEFVAELRKAPAGSRVASVESFEVVSETLPG